ncbi:TIR domain-containing protein [Sunxiuqinia sp. A32]|uniref:TIR domain-containing protein n=1 Tax=Sunxiuqinia sp. A32 TaxID=3461496 RepID=UPI00404616CC
MRKEKKYELVKFSSEKLKEGVFKWLKILPRKGRLDILARIIVSNNETWGYDSDEEFFRDFEKDHDLGYYRLCYWSENDVYYMLEIVSKKRENTTIQIVAPLREEIESIFTIFDRDLKNCKVVEITNGEEDKKPVIFIGHGSSNQWELLRNHFDTSEKYRVEEYETGSRAGHAVRDILDERSSKSSIAFIVLTCEDEGCPNKDLTKSRVIHETGLFQGKFGYNRAILLVEEGIGDMSDMLDIQQIKFPKNKIEESIKDLQEVIQREFN